MVITAFCLLLASRFASHLLMYFWKTIAAFLFFKYLRLSNIHFHIHWIMAAISCFLTWKASSVSNNVLGNRMNSFVLREKIQSLLKASANV